MHELGITTQILETALKAAEERGAARVKAIRLKIGEWTTIEPDCLEFYFEAISKGTLAEGASILVERVPLQAKCMACGSPFAPEEMVFKCPVCGSSEVEIASGREMLVDSVEVE